MKPGEQKAKPNQSNSFMEIQKKLLRPPPPLLQASNSFTPPPVLSLDKSTSSLAVSPSLGNLSASSQQVTTPALNATMLHQGLSGGSPMALMQPLNKPPPKLLSTSSVGAKIELLKIFGLSLGDVFNLNRLAI